MGVRIPNEGEDERAEHLSVRTLEAELTREIDLGREPENLALKLMDTVGEKRRGADGSRRGVTARASTVAIAALVLLFESEKLLR